MPIKLAGNAVEESSVGVRWTFAKVGGGTPIMKTLTWTLTNLDGDIMNSREDESVSNPTADETIVLSGDDLALESQSNAEEWRILTISATYDPETGGADIPIKESARFPIKNLVTVI